MDVFNDFFVIFLIAATAFFVASEFAIVAIRKPTVLQLVASEDPRAKYVKKVTSNMNDYLAACQLGNTLAALAMGWVGEATMRGWLEPLFLMLPVPESVEKPISIFVSFILITFLNVVLGTCTENIYNSKYRKSSAVYRAPACLLVPPDFSTQLAIK